MLRSAVLQAAVSAADASSAQPTTGEGYGGAHFLRYVDDLRSERFVTDIVGPVLTECPSCLCKR
jgi:hypothetical protein